MVMKINKTSRCHICKRLFNEGEALLIKRGYGFTCRCLDCHRDMPKRIKAQTKTPDKKVIR